FRRARTYLAKIAIVLQDAPGQMLMFRQLMTKIVLLTSEDQKCVKNNIRVCLSTNKCFVKVPVIAESNHSKRNYWKLDCGQITAKMVRRHFRGLLQLFPELAPKVGTKGASSKPPDQHPARQSPDPAACKAAQVRCQVKFSGPFSIESLLRRDSPSGASPRPGVQIIRAEQQQ
uniref:Si:ch211-239d6.2 n=2 Tax=Kryptolebias marmoratus TaxID=37003 RepID=A0A3Q2ZXR6_KRYMA